MSDKITCRPSLPRREAVTRPSPCAAPVTRATFMLFLFCDPGPRVCVQRPRGAFLVRMPGILPDEHKCRHHIRDRRGRVPVAFRSAEGGERDQVHVLEP